MEEWRPIEGYDDYQVSNLGRVRSLKFGEPRIRKPVPDQKGYLQVKLFKDNKGKYFMVHRLIAMAFIPNPDAKPQINHLNGVKSDNRVENLEWATQSENMRHAFAMGLNNAAQGEERVNAKLTNADVIYIRDNPDNFNLEQLAKKFNVYSSAISAIQLGKKYKNAGGKIRGKLQEAKPRVPDNIREQIRSEYQHGVLGCGSTTLAKKYGIGKTTILRIINENQS